MAPFVISQCSIADGTTLAANSIPAFWADPHWVLAWRHRTLEYHVSQIALRFPRNLLNNREALRHQKAVDIDTGRILGYARWRLPTSYEINTDDGTPTWPDAQVPAVEPGKEAEIRRIAKTVIWDPNDDADELLDRINALEKEVTPKTPYYREIFPGLTRRLIGLEYLAVHPENQRKGVGTALVKSGMDQADKMGLNIFVHALREGAELRARPGRLPVWW
ncbi:Acyl-CoA N-acyltransferase [Penicillium vulpinum]|uniref:Acyl-CoA N-acyltransferase n=1 Tax=Penicillium vulpinum TaxID=29845 RepID=UPI0025490E8D|nr:Acyl-CoA N-acyltransferase [Penicillium vulpinum]KAJ5961310.1 Acyl-CoA N-acyltransferase [Penicillium vulpinum]